MFTDVINVLIMDSDVCALQRKIDRIMVKLEIWFNGNDLIVNIGKAGVVSFHNRQSKFLEKPQVSFNNVKLNYTAEIKFLSIYITETLKWNSHVQSLTAKLSKISFMIKSSKGTLSPYMFRNICFSKFQAFLKFGTLFWGGGSWGVG
jgi:hypothetical protein